MNINIKLRGGIIMLIATSTVFAMRCPECGQLQFNTLSLFHFPAGRVLDIKCSCGAPLLNIKKQRNGGYRLQLPCVICEYKHQRQISNAQMWSKKLTTLYCIETGIELGHIGPEQRYKRQPPITIMIYWHYWNSLKGMTTLTIPVSCTR